MEDLLDLDLDDAFLDDAFLDDGDLDVGDLDDGSPESWAPAGDASLDGGDLDGGDLDVADLDEWAAAGDGFLDAGPGGWQPVPGVIDDMEPGPFLAVILSSIDPHRVHPHERVRVLQARQRMASHYAAQVYDDMAAVAAGVAEEHDDLGFADAHDIAAAEIRAALSLTRRSADAELGIALDLATRLPQVADALASGNIDPRRARCIVYGTIHLTAPEARLVADRALQRAGGLTTGRLVALIRKLSIELVPDSAARRYERAVEDRRVVVEPSEVGTANLVGLELPADRVMAATRRIDHFARSLKIDGETRTMDQLRADVLLDLLDGAGGSFADRVGPDDAAGDPRPRWRRGGGSPATEPTPATVDIRVDLATLAELNNAPGDLAGFGPVIADVARRVVARQQRAKWRFTVTDPATGAPVATGVTRRRPSASVRREVEARHPTCVFPGCRVPASRCDLDHTQPWAEGGATSPANLAPLCRHDHRLRHTGTWTYRIAEDGTPIWTSALGHIYRTDRDPP